MEVILISSRSWSQDSDVVPVPQDHLMTMVVYHTYNNEKEKQNPSMNRSCELKES